MFNIPSRYTANSLIEPKTFILRTMKKQEKERISENLLAVQLMWQIAGEEIPSLKDENYDCSVVMGLDIKLKAIKDSTFFAELIQRMVKAPCVVRFYDHAEEIYSFAHKRLSHTDATQVVIVNRVETPPLPLVLPDETAEKLKRYLAFDALLNNTDKLSLYLEATVKAFIISHPKLYNGIEDLLDQKLWYNRENFLVLFGRLLELLRLNTELRAEKLPSECAKLNGEIKKIINSVKGE
ncbi:MAG: DUF4391 domain-containing protein [Fibromonadaceae bacterium]|nr:DUF4391 domain-containing protein [Fibromonadaceae bacterium]